MSKSIKLSPKHGVNPTIPICFWCGKEKNEVALLGRIGGKEDIKAPKNMVLDFEPCADCIAKMALGVTCMECTEKPNFACSVRIFDGMVNFEKHQKIFVDSVAYQSLFGNHMIEEESIDSNSG